MAKILVIEDETLLRAEILDWLVFEGYEGLGASDGVAGVTSALRHLPDLIISDITMPQLDGYGVLLELRSNPVTARIPFIFVTARAAHDDVRKGMASGADDYITKPFTRKELLQAIESRLQKTSLFEDQRQREVDQLQTALVQEREQRMLKAKLVAMFSHDFRNPLTTILSSNSLLRDYSDRMTDERRRSHLSRIDASVRQLMQMVDDMLLVMQMDAGKLEFKPVLLNPEEFLQKVTDEFQSIYGETRHIIFESHFHDDITADPRLLRPALANLISNAIKYSPPESDVGVTLDRWNDQFMFSVQDYGIGIPEADQSRLFAAFQRGSNVEGVLGTGLGLAIVKQAVDLHQGQVSLESQVNVGTKVTIMIPTVVSLSA